MKTLTVMISLTLMAIVGLALYECRKGAQGPLIDTSQSAEVTFSDLLGKQHLGGISDLQGGAAAWQGYSASLRFNATDEVINAIIASGYQPTDAQKTTPLMQRAKLHTTFSPAWNPQDISAPECYQLQGQTAWSSNGLHTLVIDRENGVVYFSGGGT